MDKGTTSNTMATFKENEQTMMSLSKRNVAITAVNIKDGLGCWHSDVVILIDSGGCENGINK
jgi:hypothetical protein